MQDKKIKMAKQKNIVIVRKDNTTQKNQITRSGSMSAGSSFSPSFAFTVLLTLTPSILVSMHHVECHYLDTVILLTSSSMSMHARAINPMSLRVKARD